MKSRFLSLVLMLGMAGSSCAAEVLSLAGEWGFTLDFQRRGEASGWPDHKPAKGDRWDTVTVPHTFSGGDPRHEHTGAAWYVRSFDVPKEWTGSHLHLRFASVGDRCRVWLNGKLLGAHDGVNLPFSFDVTAQVERGGRNVLVLEVDNSFSDETIPGSRPGQTPNAHLYPWWNYGGIFGAVTLESEPAARVGQLRTRYDFKADGSVAVTFKTKLENRGAAAAFTLAARVTPPVPGSTAIEASQPVRLEANQSVEAALTLIIPAAQVRRWNLDRPVLYPAEVTLAGADGTKHAVQRRLGLREVAVRDAQLLLNGEPVRLAGVNRSRGHPKWGGLEPAELAALDLSMMKQAHLEFTRLQHYPIAEPLLDWADEHGLLIIAEPGNWQFSTEQLASPALRRLWQQQMREMMEGSWDRPSIIAWSVGNEYVSWSPEGVAWTKDMASFVRSIDDTRPVTFAALAREIGIKDVPPEQRSLHHVDFLCFNIYSSPQAVAGLDRVHALWPEKPIMISEFGQRADQVKNEDVRIAHFRGTLEEVRKRPFICGLSFWTFNDYLSRYPDTTPGGYRAWGLVTGDRTPRALYTAAATDLTSVVLEVEPAAGGADAATVKVAARKDFPAQTLRGYTLRVTSPAGGAVETIKLPDLAPGAAWKQDFARLPKGTTLEVVRPGGLRTATVLR
jgi:beta-glucuronidase